MGTQIKSVEDVERGGFSLSGENFGCENFPVRGRSKPDRSPALRIAQCESWKSSKRATKREREREKEAQISAVSIGKGRSPSPLFVFRRNTASNGRSASSFPEKPAEKSTSGPEPRLSISHPTDHSYSQRPTLGRFVPDVPPDSRFRPSASIRERSRLTKGRVREMRTTEDEIWSGRRIKTEDVVYSRPIESGEQRRAKGRAKGN